LDIESTKIISAALAPILLISGAGLLALSIQNRYGRVIDRIREFNLEMRGGCRDEKRRKSIDLQTELLVKRGIFLRNSLFFLFSAVIFASMSSFFILLEALAGISMEVMATLSFSLALLFMFTGMLCGIRDVSLSYTAIEKEIEIERG